MELTQVVEKENKQSAAAIGSAILSDMEFNKDKVLSLRVEEGLYKILEAQASILNAKNVSAVVRYILKLYYLPLLYELEWKNKTAEQFTGFVREKEKQGYSIEEIKHNHFMFEVVEYLEFLEQAKIRSTLSLKFMEKTENRMNKILEETTHKLAEAIQQVKEEGSIPQ